MFQVFARVSRHLLVFSLLLVAAVVLQRSIPKVSAPPNSGVTDNVQGEQTENNEYIDIDYGGSVVRVRWFKVDDPSSIEFISNYGDFVSSADAFEKYQCKKLANGGFYNVDNTPLGLVVSNGEQLYRYRENSLMNGILSINDFGTPRITSSFPSGNLENAVQSGPVLWENGNSKLLNLRSDKASRRVVSAVTGSNELYFFVLYNPESSFEGPLLVNLPSLVKEIDSRLNLNIADAINLDGGAASVFINEEVSLSELSPVGSFWCVK